MDATTTDRRRWPVSRRAFLQSAGVVSGPLVIPSGIASGQEDEEGDDTNHDDGDDRLDLERCSPATHDHSPEIDNRYFPLPVGRQLVLAGAEDDAAIRLQITVLEQTEVVGDATTRVVEEREWEDDELIEVSRNYFSQTEAGTVCYFGEAVDIYEDSEVVSNEGAWRADEPGNGPGIIMPAEPQVGMQFEQEVAPGVAEDVSIVISRGETVEVPAGTFEDTLRTYDWNELEPTVPGDVKVYAPGVGIVVDGPVELVTPVG